MGYALSLAVGIVLLTLGGEALIRGAIAASRRVGVSPLLTGLVIVGFGTSAPELVVSIDAAMNDQPDIAVGNIVGSNIGNVLLILGLCALISPMTVQPLALRRDGLVVVVASALFIVLTLSGALGRSDAFILLAGLVAYLIWAYRSESQQHIPAADMHTAEAEEVTALPQSWLTIGLAILGGLALLIGGSRLLLYGAIGIAESMGVPEAVIGLTLVAVGTSLPEMAVSVIAALRRHADVAVGNILGSNIFNVLGILGVSAILQPLPVAGRILVFDQWVMLGSAVVLLAFLYTGLRLSRVEGAILLGSYGVYVWLSFMTF
ncbi:calcium/sodium antiporter [Modicisalibacter luteus]|uniref:Calcium/sodium antiporter n=1 Tax=Modicisalibacter luteus TaxID=453962 RepID=A0ABV7M2T1_9GAMM|nr:calcium/sodium antiporter [Halomonas lutea]GHA84855.1 sodium:calcium antiporter [Halomonas lutea]